MFVPSRRDAQPGALDDFIDREPHILQSQVRGVGHAIIPFGNFEKKAFAQESLARAEFVFGADAAVDGVELLHQGKTVLAWGFSIEMGNTRLDQHGVAFAVTGEVEGVGPSRVIHIDGSGRGEHGAAGVGVSERGVAGLFTFVVSLCLHNSDGKPSSPVVVAQDFAEQFAGHDGGIVVKKIGSQKCGRCHIRRSTRKGRSVQPKVKICL